MNTTITTTEYSHEGNKRRIRIVPDLDPLNPREDPPSTTHLCLRHKRYNLPNEKPLEGWDPMNPGQSPRADVVLLPVWGYDHSSLSMKAGDRIWPFDDPWDSGLLGYIWAFKSDFPNTPDNQIAPILEAEVNEYSSFVNGAVYGYIIEELGTFTNSTFGDRDEWVPLDSCYGYYSIEEALDAAKSQANVPQGGSL